MKNPDHERIVQYYDTTSWEYGLVLMLKYHHGMHFGYYDDTHKTYPEASLNLNRVLADLGGIKKGMHVLDAGCGIGGSSVWLARERGATVVGITLSHKQCASAQSFAKRRGVSDATSFFVQDFTQTNFSDKSFDVVWAIESVCYARKKIAFLKEAYRLLRPGGSLIVADGFRSKRHYTKSEEQLMRTWLDGWVVPDIDHHEDFVKHMRHVGFNNIRYQNATPHVLPFSRWVARRASILTPIARVLQIIKVFTPVQVQNGVATVTQYKALTQKLWEYGIVIGKK